MRCDRHGGSNLRELRVTSAIVPEFGGSAEGSPMWTALSPGTTEPMIPDSPPPFQQSVQGVVFASSRG